ncbi:MAG: ferrous iron transport protein A [Deltaproteobacteria bacterium]|nr:ferrous iron transport protein A [Deltaproteobacteria bacterium]
MMERLTEATKRLEKGAEVRVGKIEGGTEVKGYLEDLGIKEGTVLRIQAEHVIHEHRGPLHLKVGERDVILGQGMADRVSVDKHGITVTLLKLEANEKGVVRGLSGGKETVEIFEKLGIAEGKEVMMLEHLPEEVFTLKVKEMEFNLGGGEASKVFVKKNRETVQLNYLNAGESGEVVDILGGTHIEQRLREVDIEPGAVITVLKREVTAQAPKRHGKVIYVRVDDEYEVSLGHGVAEKVFVEAL